MTETYVVIDLGGTRIRAARCRSDGTIEARAERPTQGYDGRAAILDRIVATAREVWPDAQPRALGVGSPGPLDPWTGTILDAPNIPAFAGLKLRDRLAEVFDLPVYVGNDANVAALAEWRFGAARGHDDVIYLTISTGIGGGIMLGGNLLLGIGGLAGELGHITIDYQGQVDQCGSIGCLEMLASGPAIRRRALARLEAGESSIIRDKIKDDLTQVSVELLGGAANDGDAFAKSIILDAARALGLGIVSLLHIFNPSIVVLGGGVTNLADHLFVPLRATVETHIMHPRFRVSIVKAQLEENVGLLGALALALDPPKQKAA